MDRNTAQRWANEASTRETEQGIDRSHDVGKAVVMCLAQRVGGKEPASSERDRVVVKADGENRKRGRNLRGILMSRLAIARGEQHKVL